MAGEAIEIPRSEDPISVEGLRLARTEDLPEVRALFREILADLEQRALPVWDEDHLAHVLEKDIFNNPAINFYRRNGFTRVPGVFVRAIDGEFVLTELPYERRL
ncbi:hypothetical protein Corgl_0457 [Coriobacterium glomerans PW2]|uniref:Uncharacterized protein n=1 Tax=Coriobacterium glomerans (strain ATCC 49209 / DSM 20642 / JCM 10262 / PW2) TaxID=700015 RepID=F2N7A0_CORGP|nr:hypothetical protein [Coriobacterium glomerans]AEB06575.1 hypothetical protein Corgl_0457 [Coriobacterium glomerans PW2]